MRTYLICRVLLSWARPEAFRRLVRMHPLDLFLKVCCLSLLVTVQVLNTTRAQRISLSRHHRCFSQRREATAGVSIESECPSIAQSSTYLSPSQVSSTSNLSTSSSPLSTSPAHPFPLDALWKENHNPDPLPIPEYGAEGKATKGRIYPEIPRFRGLVWVAASDPSSPSISTMTYLQTTLWAI